jgi:hypothetical protein
MIPAGISFSIGFILIVVWVLFWKGYAVWTAARMGHKRWFIALIVLNTFSILDIFYLFRIAKKNMSDIKAIFKRKV